MDSHGRNGGGCLPNKREAAEPRDPSRRMTGEGFTLLEVLIVIAIMLIIVAIALPRITPMLQAAHKTTIVAKLRTFTNELAAYRMDCGGIPDSLDALKPSPEKACPRGSVTFSDPAAAPSLPAVADYRISYTATNPSENGHYEGYTLSAVPSSPGSAVGNEPYFADQTGIIRVRRGETASISDPALVP
jgi:prepilin-type N-terminal cleavage/methylation domain-containing protein